MREDSNKMADDTMYDFLINFVFIFTGYLLHVYFRRQSTPSFKLGKTQVEMFGRRNNELNTDVMRTMSQVSPIERRLLNNGYSTANILEMSTQKRVQGTRSLYSEQKQAALWEQMAKPHGMCENFAKLERGLAMPAELAQRMVTLIQEKTDATAMVISLERTLESVEKCLEETRAELIQVKKDNANLNLKTLELEEEIEILEKVHRVEMNEVIEKKEAFERRLSLLERELWPSNRDVELSVDSMNDAKQKQTLDCMEVLENNMLQYKIPEYLASHDEQKHSDLEEEIHDKGQKEILLDEESEDEKVVSEYVITFKIEKSRESIKDDDEERIHKNVKLEKINNDEVISSESGNGNIYRAVKDREIDDETERTGEGDYVKNFGIVRPTVHQKEKLDETVKITENKEEELYKAAMDEKLHNEKQFKTVKSKESDDEDFEVVQLGNCNYESAETRETDEISESEDDNFDAVRAEESEDEIIEEESGESDKEDEMLHGRRRVETIFEEDEDKEGESDSGDDAEVTMYSAHPDCDEIDNLTMYFTSARPITNSPEFKWFLHNFKQ